MESGRYQEYGIGMLPEIWNWDATRNMELGRYQEYEQEASACIRNLVAVFNFLILTPEVCTRLLISY